ncbi:MAG TPA: hypothetical protein VGD57_03300 [Candidatus Dormibacteraeota bacterium]
MTERDRLDAALRAAGLKLSPSEVAALLPAWRRYRGLVETFLQATADNGPLG